MADGSGTKVGSIFYESSIDPSGVQKGEHEINKSIKNIKGGLDSLPSAAKAVGAAFAAYLGARVIIDFFKSTIDAANEANRVIAQTNAVIASTGGAAGYTSDEIAKMAAQIQNTTNVSDEAAQTGMNMLLTFTNIGHDVFPQATQAMIDMATAMNGGLTPNAETLSNTAIQLGKALQDPILGVSALRRVGVDFNQTQQDMIKHLVDTGKGMEAQKYILHELNNEFGGSAAAQAQTFEGQMIHISNSFNDFKEQIGNALIPAVSFLADSFSSAGEAGNGFIFVIRSISTAIVGLILIARELGTIIGGALATVFALFTGQTAQIGNVWKETGKEMVNIGASAQTKINDIWFGADKARLGSLEKMLKDSESAYSKNGAKIKKQLEEETQKYNDELAKRQKNYERSLADLVIAHKDKVRSLEDDLTQENKDFADKMDQRAKDFKKTMDDMKLEHEQKTADLTKDLNDEAKTHEQKTAEIQALIDQENSYGKNARQSKLTALQDELAKEMDSYNTKTADIQTKIDEENAMYAKQVADKTSADQEETTRLQAQSAQRTADIQTNLNNEQAILTAHKDIVAGIKDTQREDDIARLVRQNAEENAEAEKQHQKKMVDIVTQSGAEGTASGDAFSKNLKEEIAKLKEKIGTETKDMATIMIQNIGEGALDAGKAMVKNFINGLIDQAKAMPEVISRATGSAVSSIPGIGETLSKWANLPHFASGVRNFGGGMALVGERGPELVNLPAGADVIPTSRSGGAGQTINVYVDHIASNMDIESVAREIGFRAGIQPI